MVSLTTALLLFYILDLHQIIITLSIIPSVFALSYTFFTAVLANMRLVSSPHIFQLNLNYSVSHFATFLTFEIYRPPSPHRFLGSSIGRHEDESKYHCLLSFGFQYWLFNAINLDFLHPARWLSGDPLQLHGCLALVVCYRPESGSLASFSLHSEHLRTPSLIVCGKGPLPKRYLSVSARTPEPVKLDTANSWCLSFSHVLPPLFSSLQVDMPSTQSEACL